MDIALIIFGIGCLIGAIAGGGVKIKQKDTQLEVPLIASRGRQGLLAALGLGLIGWGAYLYNNDPMRVVATQAAAQLNAQQAAQAAQQAAAQEVLRNYTLQQQAELQRQQEAAQAVLRQLGRGQAPKEDPE